MASKGTHYGAKGAMEPLEADYIALPLVPSILIVLDSHIEAEIASFVSGSSSANATDVMLLDHLDRWDELLNVVKIAAALGARTKGLDWLDATERALGRRIVLLGCRKLFQAGISEEVRAETRTTESEVPMNAVWTGERHPGRSSRSNGF